MEQLSFPFVEISPIEPKEVILRRLESMAQKLEDWGHLGSANELWTLAFAIREGAA